MAYRDNWRTIQRTVLTLAQPRARTLAMAHQAASGGPGLGDVTVGIGSVDMLAQLTQGMASIAGGWDPDYAGYYTRILSGGLLT